MALKQVTIKVYVCDNCGRERPAGTDGNPTGGFMITGATAFAPDGQPVFTFGRNDMAYACQRRCISGAVNEVLGGPNLPDETHEDDVAQTELDAELKAEAEAHTKTEAVHDKAVATSG